MCRTLERLVRLGLACATLTLLPLATAHAAPVIYAAGDIACDPTDAGFNGGDGTATRCAQKRTSDLIVSGLAPGDSVIALGDVQYNSASLSNLQQVYDPTWGRFKAATNPVIGNHEGTSATSGAGYCTYFGAAAHCNSSGRQGGAAFYSYDAGSWHVVVLNSNCAAAGGCDVGSPQYQWLAADLAANPRACTLAAWHHPRWSTGHDGSNAFMQPIWKLLYDNGADLVLAGHSHDYERFAPIDGSGAVNQADGMRSFVVGTGGAFFTGLGGTPAAGSEARQNNTFGVLKLDLQATSYAWSFLAEPGRLFTDSGTQRCRGTDVPPPPPPPPPPTTRTVTVFPEADTMVKHASPAAAFGATTPLVADGQELSTAGSEVNAYLRFAVPALAPGETIADARLSVNVSNPTGNGPAIVATDASWSETAMTWNAGRPARGAAVGNFGAMATGRVGTAVSGVTGGALASFELVPESTDGLGFASREDGGAGTTNDPQLVLTIQTSGGTPPPPPPPPPTTRTVTVFPEADTMVKHASPAAAFGATTPLVVDGQELATTGSEVSSYLRFAVPAPAAGETITAAGLSVNVSNATGNGPAVFRTDTSWSEAAMTWNAGRPARTAGAAVGNFGSMATGRVSTPVSGITSAGLLSLELAPESTDGLGFASREDGGAGTTNDPQLVLTIQSG